MKSVKSIRKYNKAKIIEIIGPDINVRDIIDFFDNIFDQIIIVDYFNRTNYIIGNIVYFQDQKNGELWVNYGKIWLILRDQYSLSYEQIRGLIKIMVEIPYELGSLTPIHIIWY